jgi:hypothetical protein
MKKRDKKLAVSRETIRDLSTPETRMVLQGVVGGTGDELATCIPGGTTHCTNLC